MSNAIVDVLLIEASPEKALLFDEMLARSDARMKFRLRNVGTLEAGLACLAEKNEFKLILLNLNLPDSSGLETFVQIAEIVSDVAIVVLSSIDDAVLAAETVQLGAQDYLVHGHFDHHLLIRSMQYAVEVKRGALQLKRAYEELESRVKERTGVLQQANTRLQKEIAERKRDEEKTLESNHQLSAALGQLQAAQAESGEHLRLEKLESIAGTLFNDFNQAFSPVLDSCEILINDSQLLANPLKVENFIRLIQQSAMESAAVVERLEEFQTSRTDAQESAGTEAVSGHISLNSEESSGALQASPSVSTPQYLNILVVDDEPLVREVIGMYLREDNHIITNACNGVEGLEKFRAATFDLVLTDRAMPEMNGEQLAKEIKLLNPAQPVVLLTGYGELAGSKLDGVDLVVSKPFTSDMLRSAIFSSVVK